MMVAITAVVAATSSLVLVDVHKQHRSTEAKYVKAFMCVGPTVPGAFGPQRAISKLARGMRLERLAVPETR